MIRSSKIIPALIFCPLSSCSKFDFYSHFQILGGVSMILTQVYFNFEREIMPTSIHHLIIKSSH